MTEPVERLNTLRVDSIKEFARLAREDVAELGAQLASAAMRSTLKARADQAEVELWRAALADWQQ